jgi:hypothetical protein
MLATYPSDAPRHGGQRRVNAISQSFRDAGWDVKQIGVFPEGTFSSNAPPGTHVLLPRKFNEQLAGEGLRADLHATLYFTDNPSARDRLADAIIRYHPHVVTVEQPWLFPAIRDLVDSPSRPFLFVNSTQNVEHDLMLAILDQEGHPWAEDWGCEAAHLERAATLAADLTICVTERDAGHFRALGARTITIAPNGAHRRPTTTSSRWHSGVTGSRYAFVIGSAHPPNCTGFLELLGAAFAFVPPGSKVVIAGGMATLLACSREFRLNRELVAERAVLIPDPAEADIDHLINHAAVVLLPITHGGGSNVKTAEAILTDRPIIGTTTAFRGFSTFRAAPGVRVEDEPARYRQLVRHALAEQDTASFYRPTSETLLWKNCVGHLPALVHGLLHRRLTG